MSFSDLLDFHWISFNYLLDLGCFLLSFEHLLGDRFDHFWGIFWEIWCAM